MITMITTILQADPAQGSWSMWIMLILLFLVMWLFMIRPQRKQQKALEEMRKALKKGDHVVTAGGIYGVRANRKYEERNKEKRQAASGNFQTMIPRELFDEINAFLKERNMSKVDFIKKAYELMKNIQ